MCCLYVDFHVYRIDMCFITLSSVPCVYVRLSDRFVGIISDISHMPCGRSTFVNITVDNCRRPDWMGYLGLKIDSVHDEFLNYIFTKTLQILITL